MALNRGVATPTPVPAAPDGFRFVLALKLGHVAAWLSRRILRRSGGVIGGRVLAAIAPGSAKALAERHRIVLVSGTNGKSTTTAMMTAALATRGEVATNSDGANTPPGLLWALANARPTDVVLEVDEAWVPWAVREFSPYAVLLLNLTRDQLHRNPEVGRLAGGWRGAVDAVPVVVANADDPWVAWAAETGGRQVWVGAGQEWDEDSLVCPECGRLLDRTGAWSCACGRSRPETSWNRGPDGTVLPPTGPPLHYGTLPGSGNLANAAMVLAAASELGVEPAQALRGLETVTNVAGRYATVHAQHHDVRLVLAKNPASWRTSMALISDHDGAVVLAFNADGADGRDPSWLYDVDFSELRGRQVVVCGERATDLAVRLDLDGVEVEGQYGDLSGALRAMPPGPVDLVATYTAFQRARRELGGAA